jgi:dihydropteroate synthase
VVAVPAAGVRARTVPGPDWLPADRPALMGVLNATPDSFWAGSRYPDPDAAAAAARQMVAAGADLIDVGAVSSRPGAPDVSEAEELRRLLPVLRAVRAAVGCPISVDTARSGVAEAALRAGANVINDVSGLADPRLAEVAARAGAVLVLCASGPLDPRADPVPAVADALRALRQAALAAGVRPEHVILDPGFGFGKTPAQNLRLISALPALRRRVGAPVCIGPSRKGTIASVLGDRPPEARGPGTAALVALCAAYGADVVRVHDVAEMADVARVAAAVGLPRSGAEGVGLVCIRGIRIEARHGVLPEEQRRAQPFVVDLEMAVPLARAARSDDLADTVDYAAVAEVAAAVLSGPPRRLLERLAAEIAEQVLQRFPAVLGGTVTVHKPAAPLGLPFGDVFVRIPFGCWDGAPVGAGAGGADVTCGPT